MQSILVRLRMATSRSKGILMRLLMTESVRKLTE